MFILSSDHPALETAQSRRGFRTLALMRSAFMLFLAFALNRVIELGTPPLVLGLSGVAGVAIASRLAFSRLSSLAFGCVLALLYALLRLIEELGAALPLNGLKSVFAFFELGQHLGLMLLMFCAGAVTTWLFWRLRHYLTFELLALLSIAILAFAGHRNFHFDAPRMINDLSWHFGLEPLSILILLGSAIVTFTFAYLFFATSPNRPVASRRAELVHAHRSKASLAATSLIALTVAGVVYLVSNELYKYFNAVSLTRIANGVGFENKEGMSPLGFHSALGGTNQPSALVRLEGDYSENPHTPMLYMRESALSQFNGHEMAIAAREFDTDVTHTSPREAFVGVEDVTLQKRVPIAQSIYLLSDHKQAFAIDYPLSIKQLKNPNPKRFKATFRSYSMAPAYPLDELLDATPGDQRWSPETWQHYLATHPDIRYKDFAEKITKDETNAVKKVLAITSFLSAKAIYTLTPNHNVKPADDPVAPFLFGDLRGYCVHFSHATVYMLRSLGIPARIGTGYLTDLSQAKDGHILMRMSDRHAWAEIYLAGYGWVPFDTQPDQVESHADTQVDMKLLEELMGMLDPGEEILPDKITREDPDLQPQGDLYTPGLPELVVCLIAILLGIFAGKAYLRFGWMLPGSALRRLKRSYIAVLSSLHDLGYRRGEGETRNEFRRRVQEDLGFEILSLTDGLVQAAYGRPGTALPSEPEIDSRRRADIERLTGLPWKRRLSGALNPSSVFTGIMGARW